MDIENEIQSWIAVRSFAVEDANPQAPIIDANELAESVTEVFKKLEGCVVVPESEYNDMAQYKDIYKRAIVNAKKRKNQINWAHVAGLGVGSGRAVELCKELKIDPHATDMNATLEAARDGNE